MAKAGIASALLVLLLGLATATGADARHRRHHHYGDYDTSGFTRGGDDASRAGASARPPPQARAPRTGAFGAVIARLIRGCAQRADELAHLPLDAIAQIVAPDETQRGALDSLRAAAAQAAQRLSSDCPQDVPASPSAQLNAVAAGLDAGLAAFAGVQPPLEQLYAALDDEQKARLLRDMTLRGAPAATADSGARAQAQQEDQTQGRSRQPMDATDGRSARRLDRDSAELPDARSYRRAYRDYRRRSYESASNRAADSVRSPPPCGEGLGVGVSERITRSPHRHSPPISTFPPSAEHGQEQPPPISGPAPARISPPRCAAGRSARSSATCA